MGCIFCEIVTRQRPADIVYEDEHALAFRDVRPQAPVHILIVPRKHIIGPAEVDGANEQMAGHLVAAAVLIAQQEGIATEGYRLVLNQGSHGGQSVFHLHLHLLGGRRMGWPPG
jgi:histidine triad (HIT) family protein